MDLPSPVFQKLADAYRGRTVTITGGAGFIGSHLVDTLFAAGARLRIIDDLSNAALDHIGELIELEPDRVRFVYGSILDDRALEEAVDASEVVFHLAALGSVPRSIDQPGRTFDVNAAGTLRVLQAAKRAGVKRVVFAGSSSAYGNSERTPAHESHPPSSISPYAASKIAGEQLVSAWANSYGLQGVSLRFFNVFGPRQRADSQYAGVVAAFSAAALAGRAPVIFGDGSQSRDFTYVANAVLAASLAGSVERPFAGEVLNIGTGVATTVLELAHKVADQCAADAHDPVHKPERTGEVLHSLADITAARELLGYEPVVDIDRGLALTCDWARTVRAEAEA